MELNEQMCINSNWHKVMLKNKFYCMKKTNKKKLNSRNLTQTIILIHWADSELCP